MEGSKNLLVPKGKLINVVFHLKYKLIYIQYQNKIIYNIKCLIIFNQKDIDFLGLQINTTSTMWYNKIQKKVIAIHNALKKLLFPLFDRKKTHMRWY